MDSKPTLEINKFGTKFWRLNGKLHRKDGPAAEYSNGDKRWFLDGKFHRDDGPAVEEASGRIHWWLNDECYVFEEWLEVNTSLSDEEKVMMILTYG